jgi:uncharacterized protein
MKEKICPGCGTKVGCGAAPGKDHCWCADLPRIMPVPDVGTDCLCPECLRREIARRREGARPEGGAP